MSDSLKKKITLPDAGPIELDLSLTVGTLHEYDLKFENEPDKAFFNLLNTCIAPKDADTLSLNDLNFLAEELSRELDVLEVYQSEFKSAKSSAEAFGIAFAASEYIKSRKRFENVFTISAAALRGIGESSRFSNSIVNNMKSVLERHKNLFAMPYFKTAIEKSILNQPKIFELSFIRPKSLDMQVKYFDSQTVLFQKLTAVSGAVNPQFNQLFEKLKDAHVSTRALSLQTSQIAGLLGDLKKQEFKTLPQINDFFKQTGSLSRQANEYFRKKIDLRPKIIEIPAESEDSEIGIEYDTAESAIHDGVTGVIEFTEKSVHTLKEIVGDAIEDRFRPYQALLERFNFLLRPQNFFDTLRAFCVSLARNHWQTYWAEGGKRFKEKPESIAQTNLSLFLEGRMGDIAFVGREIRNGDGFVDILVSFLGVNYIVEIKMIGANYSVGWAESGISQLDTYMGNFNLREAHLLILDGRKTVQGRNFSEYYDRQNGRIHVHIARIFADGT